MENAAQSCQHILARVPNTVYRPALQDRFPCRSTQRNCGLVSHVVAWPMEMQPTKQWQRSCALTHAAPTQPCPAYGRGTAVYI